MSTGALIFAHNNTGIDYTKLAVFSASRIKKFLNIPVSLVTDNPQWLYDNYPTNPFDGVIEIPSEVSTQKVFYDGTLSSKKLDWKNVTRYQAYNLTPYDTTLVIDSDYILASDILKKALCRDVPFQLYKQSFDLADWRDRSPYQRINHYSVPFYWATVLVFKKDPIAKSLFDLVNYIKQNWIYFRALYSIETVTFRNDFAFSIAIHIMNGKTEGDIAVDLPGAMTYIEDRDVLLEIKEDSFKFLIQKKNHLGEYIAAKTSGIDVHVMNKSSLSRVIDGGAI